MKLKSCMRRASDSIDKRFCFDVTVDDRGNESTMTFQAFSEEERKSWIDAMDGREPVCSIVHINYHLLLLTTVINDASSSFQVYSPGTSGKTVESEWH